MMKILGLVVLLSLFLHETYGDTPGYRILAIARYRYTQNSQTLLNWGFLLGNDNGRGSWITWDAHRCWAPERNNWGYCQIRFKVTQEEGVEHYQILGGELKQYDGQSRYLYHVAKWGETEKGTKAPAGDGEGWVAHGYNDWGYQYRYFYVNKTREAPLIQAFGSRVRQSGGNPKFKDYSITGSTRESTQIHLDDFRVWSSDWNWNTELQLFLYTAKTVLKGMEFDTDNKELVNSNEGSPGQVLDERILVNDNCGNEYVEGQTGERVTELTVTLTESVTWSQTFGFGFSIGYEASFDVGVVSNTVSVGLEFNYELSEEFSSTKTVEQKETYKWPSICAPGNKCKTTLLKTRQQFKVPVIFTFERNGEQFTLTNEMLTTIETFRDESHRPEPIDGSEPCLGQK